MENNDLEISPLENGLDFIVSALEYLDKQNQLHHLKYAILHLSSGVELILKERLRLQHWSFVFSNINKANEQSYKSGDFCSVNFDECIKRLENICGIKFSENDKKQLRNLRSKRNKLEHFGIVDSSEALKAVLAEVLNFLIDFVNDELIDIINQDEGIIEYIDIVREKALNFNDFVSHRMNNLKDDLEKLSIVLTCPKCLQDAGTFDLDDFYCCFCQYRNNDPIVVAREYVHEVLGISHYFVKDGGEWPIYFCPSCSIESFVKGYEGYICFACHEQWTDDNIDFCESCGYPFMVDKEHPISICDECIEMRFSD